MKYIQPVFWALVCGSLFLFLQHEFKFYFFYIEQTHIFLYSGQFACDVIRPTGGLSLYVALFIVQFYLLPLLGPLINALLLSAVGFLFHRILNAIAAIRLNGFISLFPVAAFLYFHINMHYQLQGTVAFLFMLAALSVYIQIRPPLLRVAAGLLLTLLLFWIAGSVAVLFVVLSIFIDLLTHKPKFLLSLIYLPAILTVGCWAVYSGRQGSFNMAFSPDMYYEPLIHSKTILLTWVVAPVCMLLTYGFRRVKALYRPEKWQFDIVLQITPLFLFMAWVNYQKNETLLLNIEQDYYLRNGLWDEIIAGFSGEDKCNMQTMNVLNLALAQKGELGNQLFAYNHQGYQTILAYWNSSLPAAIALSDVFYHIGDMAAAQKMAFEAAVASPHEGCVRAYKRLIETNIVFGAYPVAEKYINLLENTFFYSREAGAFRRFLYDDTAVEQDPEFGFKRKGLVQNNRYAVSNQVMETMEILVNHNPANQIAMQYLLAICLTNKDLKYFRTLLEKYFRTDKLPVLSTSHQEAVIVLEQDNPAFWIKNGVSTKTEQRFRAFDQDMQNQRIPNFNEKMKSSHGNTFWYYLVFSKNKTNKDNETIHQHSVDYASRSLP